MKSLPQLGLLALISIIAGCGRSQRTEWLIAAENSSGKNCSINIELGEDSQGKIRVADLTKGPVNLSSGSAPVLIRRVKVICDGVEETLEPRSGLSPGQRLLISVDSDGKAKMNIDAR